MSLRLGQCPSGTGNAIGHTFVVMAAALTIADRMIELRDWIESGYAEELRTAAGLPRRAIASSLDVTETTVWRWERGSRQSGGRLPRGRNAIEYHRMLTRLARSRQARAAAGCLTP